MYCSCERKQTWISMQLYVYLLNVSKMYKLYDKPSDRLKEALGFTKKVRYKEYYALKDLSFDVKRGETVGIIGTNGAENPRY